MKSIQLIALFILTTTMTAVFADGKSYKDEYMGKTYPESIGGYAGNTIDRTLALPGTVLTGKTPKERRKEAKKEKRKYEKQERQRDSYE
jgi:hypothetical protein